MSNHSTDPRASLLDVPKGAADALTPIWLAAFDRLLGRQG